MDSHTNIKTILQKYLKNLCSPEEAELLFRYLRTSDDLSEIEQFVEDVLNSSQTERKEIPDLEVAFTSIYERINSREKEVPETALVVPIRKAILKYISVAAMLALAFVAGQRYFYGGSHAIKQNTSIAILKDFNPGGNKAILQLANGKKIALDDQANGTLANDRSVKIEKRANGQLVYTFNDKSAPEANNLNTLSTPKGGQYQVKLADGTKVWLNSLSTITFPATFEGNERNVTIKGEVYFEVAHNKEKPFIVTSGNNKIRVLGTKFNITAYPDEAKFKATLVEGSIAIKHNEKSGMLKPGDQAVVNSGDPAGEINIRKVDALRETAWKDGYFSFKESDPEEVMRELARWYDFDIKYEAKPGVSKITGRIKKQVRLSKVLEMLEFTGMSFKINGKTVIIER